MKKLIASIALGLAVLGFAGASFAQAASAPEVAASAAAMASAAAPAPAAAASAAPAAVPNKGDTAFMMTATALVVLMTIPGLALFYGGLVRSKNMLSVLMQVFMIFSLISVLWVVYGYSGDPVELTHGDQIRDFNDVDVVSQAFVDALGAPEAACGAVYHIGSGIGTRVRELALRVAAMVGGIDLIRFGAAETQDEAVPILVSDPSLATQTLGWRPELDLEARLRETVDWWLPQLEPLASREVSA